MTNLYDLTTSQLNRVIAIKEQIERLQSELQSIAGDGQALPAASEGGGKKRHMSAAGRARIAAAARARWAEYRGSAAPSAPAKKGKRRLSAAGRAAIIAGTKARWAKARAAAPVHTESAPQKADRRTSPAVKAKLAAIARARWAKARAAGKAKL